MKRVILFESEPFLGKFISETLKLEGHEVFVLESPLEAEFMIQDINPDIILYSYDSYEKEWQQFAGKYPAEDLLAISSSQITGANVLLKPVSKKQLLKRIDSLK